jgi:hypothetical protein
MATKSPINITCTADTSPDQQQAFESAYGYGVGRQVAAVDPVVVGTIIFSLSFATKAFFDAFLKEAGKDSYNWLKVKLGIEAAEKLAPLKTAYTIVIEDLRIIDLLDHHATNRHDLVLAAVSKCVEQLQASDKTHQTTVLLKYDATNASYSPHEIIIPETSSQISADLVEFAHQMLGKTNG